MSTEAEIRNAIQSNLEQLRSSIGDSAHLDRIEPESGAAWGFEVTTKNGHFFRIAFLDSEKYCISSSAVIKVRGRAYRRPVLFDGANVRLGRLYFFIEPRDPETQSPGEAPLLQADQQDYLAEDFFTKAQG